MVIEGQLFSEQYSERDAPPLDSKRFRLRIATAYEVMFPSHSRMPVADAIRLKLGVEVPFGYGGYLFSEFFAEAELRDVMDAATIIFDVLHARYSADAAGAWRAFVERAFKSENLPYRMDAKGGVHRVLDPEPDRNRTTALRSLAASRYTMVAAALGSAFAELERTRADAGKAVNDCLTAARTLVKLLTGANGALDKALIEASITPLVDRAYQADAAIASASRHIVSSFGNWADAANAFEHGGSRKPPAIVPAELAALLVSSGAAYIRWLVELDQRANT
jgi:hypothetical protein